MREAEEWQVADSLLPIKSGPSSWVADKVSSALISAGCALRGRYFLDDCAECSPAR